MKKTSIIKSLVFLFTIVCFLSACSEPAIEPRNVIPADALVYLETADLGKAISATTDSEKFRAEAASVPNLALFNGIKLSVAVTGFETKESPAKGESSVLNFQPRFVAVAETNAWNYQANSFAENKLGEFINDAYGGEVELVTSAKYDGKFYTWTAKDGRKAYALVQGSVVYFGNDTSAIEKCQAVKRGETESIASSEKLNDSGRLAFGFVSQDGMAQLANIVGISLAMKAGEDADIKSFIARVLPEILRNSIIEMSWTAKKTDVGIEDTYHLKLNPEVAKAANETIGKIGSATDNFADFVPQNTASVTRYDLSDPKLAWQKTLGIVRSRTDAVSGNLIGTFSNSLFEPYAIEDPDKFLEAIGGRILTVKLDAENENAVVIAEVKKLEDVKASLAKEISFAKSPEKQGDAEVWRSNDGDFAAAFVNNIIIAGDAEVVMKCLAAKQSGDNITQLLRFNQFNSQKGSAVTFAAETDRDAKLVEMLGGRKDESKPLMMRYMTTTSFDQNGINRVTASDFGLIGTIIEQLGKQTPDE